MAEGGSPKEGAVALLLGQRLSGPKYTIAWLMGFVARPPNMEPQRQVEALKAELAEERRRTLEVRI